MLVADGLVTDKVSVPAQPSAGCSERCLEERLSGRETVGSLLGRLRRAARTTPLSTAVPLGRSLFVGVGAVLPPGEGFRDATTPHDLRSVFAVVDAAVLLVRVRATGAAGRGRSVVVTAVRRRVC